jgi:hypothetical protein
MLSKIDKEVIFFMGGIWEVLDGARSAFDICDHIKTSNSRF